MAHFEGTDIDVLGMTLAEYAAARRTHPQAVRLEYGRRLRSGADVAPLRPSRCERQDGLIKFCLPVGERAGHVLETESVLIPMHSYRGTSWYTLCVSSQVGCRMACTFCDTGHMGLLRNLTASEIVRQRLAAAQLLPRPANQPFRYFADGIRNIVFMGMGEPLDNFDQVVQAIRVLNEPNGMDVPLGQITVSTVGHVDGLCKLAALPRGRDWPNLRIAVSLNAANDALRETLVPVSKGTPLAELQRTLLEYPLARKGRYLIEYVLIKDVNDALQHADEVAAWCRPLPCIVNLIPYNPQRHATYETPSDATVMRFLLRLRAQGIFVKRRVTYGRDLMGACGQLGNPELRHVQRGPRSGMPSPLLDRCLPPYR